MAVRIAKHFLFPSYHTSAKNADKPFGIPLTKAPRDYLRTVPRLVAMVVHKNMLDTTNRRTCFPPPPLPPVTFLCASEPPYCRAMLSPSSL